MVAEEQDTLALALGLSARLNPLTHARRLVQGLDEANRTILDVSTVVLAHNGLNGIGSLVGVVEGDSADVVMKDVGLDDAVEEVASDEAHLAVDSGSGAADEVPLTSGVVRKGRVGVLEEGNGNCQGKLADSHKIRNETVGTYRASG